MTAQRPPAWGDPPAPVRAGPGGRRRRGPLGRSRRVQEPALLLADVAALGSLAVAVWPLGAVYASSVVAATALTGGYRRRASLSLAEEIPPLLTRLAVLAVLLGSASVAFPAVEASLPSLLRWLPISVALLCATRLVAFEVISRRRARRRDLEPTVVVGAGAVGQQIAQTLLARPRHGLLPIGFVDDVDEPDLVLPVLGEVADLPELLDRHGARSIVIAFGPSTDGAVLVDALRRCETVGIDVHVVPRLFELRAPAGAEVQDIWGLPMHRLPDAAMVRPSWRLKRAFDVAVAGAALVLLAPALLGLAVAVRATSPGPALLRQTRVGQGGREFEVLKFRTMYVNHDSDTTWSVTSDPRVTPLGRILRPTCVDELPQLVNVLRGDMSLVGPRPERPHFVDQFSTTIPRYGDRHRVPVGMTGLAQVNGLRGDSSIEDRATFDNRYVERWSLWRDLVILSRTVTTIIKPPETVQVGPARPVGAQAHDGPGSSAQPIQHHRGPRDPQPTRRFLDPVPPAVDTIGARSAS